MRAKLFNKSNTSKKKFSIRKSTLGVASVVIASLFFMATEVAAEEVILPEVGLGLVVNDFEEEEANHSEAELIVEDNLSSDEEVATVSEENSEAEEIVISQEESNTDEQANNEVESQGLEENASQPSYLLENEIDASMDRITDNWDANSVEQIEEEIKRQEKIELPHYVVQWGDTLGRLAKASQLELDFIVEQNNIANPDKIYVGQLLSHILNGHHTELPSQPEPKEDSDEQNNIMEVEQDKALEGITLTWEANTVGMIDNEINRQEELGLRDYVIQWGDTLNRISQASLKSVEELVALNAIKNPDLIYTGSILKGVLQYCTPELPEEEPIEEETPGTELTEDKPGEDLPVENGNEYFTDEEMKIISEYIYETTLDSDGDGLSDYDEKHIYFTNPYEADSNNNGILDGDEDLDGDGLSVREELDIYQTNPAYDDTDYDELNDGDEVLIYGTDPNKADTDGDGARDGWEVFNGYDPLSFNDVFDVVKEYLFDDNKKVTVDIDLKGDQVESLYLRPSHSPLLTDTIPGIIGQAINIDVAGEFNQARIGFQFDTDLLVDSNLNPTIYYFNEATQLLEEIRTTIEDDMAYAWVDHFSNYLLVDKFEYDKQWHDYLRPITEDNSNYISFVIDQSNSMRDHDPEDIRISLTKDFVNNLTEEDKISLITFGSRVTQRQSLTDNKEEFLKKLDNLRYVGGTNIYGAVNQAINSLNSIEGNKYKSVIIISDGEDTENSISKIHNAIQNAKEKNVIVYSIGLTPNADSTLLKKIADETGGQFYFASDANHLSDVFRETQIEIIEGNEFNPKLEEIGIQLPNYIIKAIYESKLKAGTGLREFNHDLIQHFEETYGISVNEATYDQLAEHLISDIDNDGLNNLTEFEVKTAGEKYYIYFHSNPFDFDTDGDGYIDSSEDTRESRREWEISDRDLALFASLAYHKESDLLRFFSKGFYNNFNITTEDGRIVLSKAPISENVNIYEDYEALSEIRLFREWRVTEYVQETYKLLGFNLNFNAMTFINDYTKQAVVAFRGTKEDGNLHWVELASNLSILWNGHPQADMARNYISRINLLYGQTMDLYVTGHSLGGYLAYEAAEQINLNPNFIKAYNYNGPGLGLGKESIELAGKTVSYAVSTLDGPSLIFDTIVSIVKNIATDIIIQRNENRVALLPIKLFHTPADKITNVLNTVIWKTFMHKSMQEVPIWDNEFNNWDPIYGHSMDHFLKEFITGYRQTDGSHLIGTSK